MFRWWLKQGEHTNEEKKQFIVSTTAILMLFLTGCENKALDEAKAAAEKYNQIVVPYNEQIKPYNDTVEAFKAANDDLGAAISSAQEMLNSGEEPFNDGMLISLKEAISTSSMAMNSVPEVIPERETIIVSESAIKSELTELTQHINKLIDEINGFTLPEIPSIPDYTELINSLDDAENAYQNSVISMRQVTAPTDEFVISRLQGIESILEIAPVTENHDPNGQLNKQGGYIGCVYFSDTQVDRSQIYIEPGHDNVIDVGTSGGGSIEIFSSVQDAQKRDAYLGGFDGTAFVSGSHYIVGTCVVRTSNALTGTQQRELTERITAALTEVRE